MGTNGWGVAPKLTYRLQHSKLHLPKLILLHPGLTDDFGTPFPGFLRGNREGGGQAWTLLEPLPAAPAGSLLRAPAPDRNPG